VSVAGKKLSCLMNAKGQSLDVEYAEASFVKIVQPEEISAKNA